MKTKRDPRLNPKVGDRLVVTRGTAKHYRIVYGVDRHVKNDVCYVNGRDRIHPHITTIEEWRNWAKNAEVVTRRSRTI